MRADHSRACVGMEAARRCEIIASVLIDRKRNCRAVSSSCTCMSVKVSDLLVAYCYE